MGTQHFLLNFVGDVMLGRLIDQMFPQHVHEPEEARIAKSFQSSRPDIKEYDALTPWSNTISLFNADLNLINLETAVTTHSEKWPEKTFNYRMNPANVTALKAAKIHYATLSNNHSLDFCEPGLRETVKTLRDAGIAYAGAGESAHEAVRPAILHLQGKTSHEVHVWAASDHPRDWAKVPGFHLIDYTAQTRQRLKTLLTASSSDRASLKVFSVHWGPNYSWQPDRKIRALAHFLIDECGIDIIHGHSSHHVQGVERYAGKNKPGLIIYGCGDFVDDYALVADYRNDLSGVWRVTAEELVGGNKLRPKQLEVFPTKIDAFRARRLQPQEPDADFVRSKIKELSAEFGTKSVEQGDDGRLIFDLT